MNFRKLLTGLCALTFASAAGATTIFDLSGSIGATPTFSITSGGTTATFTSPTGNQFAVQDTTGLLTFSTALLDSNFFGTDNLTIAFSQSVTNTVYIPFAILDAFGSGDTLTATANTGQTSTFLTTPDNLSLAEPEGLVAFRPTSAITSLTLSSPTFAFAVGNAQIPEPMTGLLVGVGLAGLIATRRRSNPR